ncbi:MAG: GNAT family N-acetyltransferase [Ilumatobacteraceae bacterium]
MLDARDLTVAFDGGEAVLAGVSLHVGDSEVVALLGPSGSGKSTLLRIVAGLLVPDRGRILVDGRDVTETPTHRRGVGMVFQDEQLFPHRSVAANVDFGLRMLPTDRRPPAAERSRRVAELLAIVGLAGFEHRRVTELSGGEAKRVALARSLAPSPRVLLLDEPLTGLDRELHDRLTGELARILRATGTTSLLVTHDAAEAAAVADRVVRMTELVELTNLVEVAELAELTAAETHPLRRAVLRVGTPTSAVVWAGDDAPGTWHLGLRQDGALVAISTWLPAPFPGPAGSAADVQLRGMAVESGRQGQGLGAQLVAAGVERAFADGATSVWANARDTALAFYVGNGFAVVGDGFLTADTALPHHRIRRLPLPPIGDTQGGWEGSRRPRK